MTDQPKQSEVQPEPKSEPKPTQAMKRALWRGVKFIAVTYVTIIIVMALFENSLIYPAQKFPDGRWDAVDLAVKNKQIEEIEFVSSDKTKLHGLLAEAKKPRGYLLYCHGNAGNVTQRLETVVYLRDRYQLSVFVFDYRGYGKSEGKPNEAGVIRDARAARDWLAKRGGIQPKEVLLLGRSLGGGVAVDLAANDGTCGLILQSTFTTLPDVASNFFPWLPVRWIMRNRFDSLEKIKKYKGPLLASHGTNDEVISFEIGKKLYEAAAGKKSFLVIENAHHNDPQPTIYYERLQTFLDDILKKQNKAKN